MRRVLVFSLMALAMLSVGSVLRAGNGQGPGDGTGTGICTCKYCIDFDCDGICDVCHDCIPVGDGPKGPKGPKGGVSGDRTGARFMKHLAGNGQGPGDGTGTGICTCKYCIDVDGDGICDACHDCIPVGDGPKGPQGPKKTLIAARS